jgi:hypothetical protein
VAVTRTVGLTGITQPAVGVLADGLQQQEPRRATAGVGNHQGLVYQPAHTGEHVVASDHPAGADRPRGVQVEPGREHREAAEQCPIRLAEQIMAPADGRRQGLLPGGDAAGAAHEQPEPVVQALLDLLRGQGAQPRGRELDGQRDAVEPGAHHLRRGLAGPVQGERLPDLARPLDE